jgi:hypothetical protein
LCPEGVSATCTCPRGYHEENDYVLRGV